MYQLEMLYQLALYVGMARGFLLKNNRFVSSVFDCYVIPVGCR